MTKTPFPFLLALFIAGAATVVILQQNEVNAELRARVEGLEALEEQRMQLDQTREERQKWSLSEHTRLTTDSDKIRQP